MLGKRTALILSVGYGMGHHAAARSVSEELQRRGWCTICSDPCMESRPVLFSATRRFYHFCVRRAPWIWGVTYEQTDNSDWAAIVRKPVFNTCTEKILSLIREHKPDVCICTYPLFAHMLDALNAERAEKIPYAMVVTDALEISRPWATSKAPLLFVPDEKSRTLLMERYGIAPERIISSGFPVRSAFLGAGPRSAPSPENLRLVYGAFVPLAQARSDIHAMVHAYPHAKIVLLAGERQKALAHLAAEYPVNIELRGHADDMPELFAWAHLYVGKAGASTMFEAYACALPVIVNYALPGQEQGNLELLLTDGAGLHAEGSEALLHAISTLLYNDAALWRLCSARMHTLQRANGAACIADALERRLA